MPEWTVRLFRKSPWRAFLLLVVGALAAYQGGSTLVVAQAPQDKVDAAVLASAAKGATTFWVYMREEANLDAAPGIRDDNERGTFVYRKLNEIADRSQGELRAELDDRGAKYKPFWIVNAIRVTGDEGLLLDIAARPDVKAIEAEGVLYIPTPRPGREEPRIEGIQWNIERIKAQKVWTQLNDRGENMVVANIDTGVQYDHSALANQYRGNQGGGNFDHNFNWFDPTDTCGNPSVAPCDNVGHGTHTMGTMVGDDGNPGPNQIGVAPKAKWIACKGCRTGTCLLSTLLACGQWILAPTDLNGNNPNPALRPHVVNNSWAYPGGLDFYSATVNAWVASGIFPAFAIGNSGPTCGSADSPGDYVNSYGAGAYDINNNIANFSARGPSAFGGEIKPNIAAPGVNVRSSIPPNAYTSLSGTSMASPHVAGTVALIWSRSMTVRRDVAATRLLLDHFAKDRSDRSCGGNAHDNNIWGEGRLNAFESTKNAPQ